MCLSGAVLILFTLEVWGHHASWSEGVISAHNLPLIFCASKIGFVIKIDRFPLQIVKISPYSKTPQ